MGKRRFSDTNRTSPLLTTIFPLLKGHHDFSWSFTYHLNARREGKIAYLIMDKLIIHERGKFNPGRPPGDATTAEYNNFVNVDDEDFVKNGCKRC